ncbi:DNA adenine methylase [Virgibacillus sp. NKC19-16]|uniref:DNA adenine methylase n=1 Tax=Virgibacillus salidurans TaxID=2831673 RepID=UPI001F2CA19A|nr:DNA adenine methylase [Virgibacillus sp. NKC19-16]UJL46352.1 DNA adenine methylase [Virgibacillus sp. NKC19-16]
MNKKIDNYSPLRYPGGKNKLYSYLRYIIKENEVSNYIEPYCGGAAIALKLLINQDVKKIMINDYDKSIYSLWYSILNNSEEMKQRVYNARFNMNEWNFQKDIQQKKDNVSLIELGFSTLFLNRTNRSGIINAGPIGGKKQNGNYKMDCRFNKEALIRKIDLISSLGSKINLYNKDALDFISTNISKTRNSLTFFDPPYYVKGRELYTNFYEHVDHVDLRNSINNTMKNKKWILTYDLSSDIKNLYSQYEYYTYYLNYSLANSRKGKELIIYSNSVSSSNVDEFLQL